MKNQPDEKCHFLVRFWINVVLFIDSFGSSRVELEPGTYKFELWGASASDSRSHGSLGAYVSGDIKIESRQIFFAYIGESGKQNSNLRTFNGGRKVQPSSNSIAFSGGGSTDIRLQEGTDFSSLKTRIIVAGGAGWLASYNNPTSGGHGGFNGFDGLYSQCPSCSTVTPIINATGGTQDSYGIAGGGPNGCLGKNGTFGQGGDGSGGEYCYWTTGAGGGGYWGGGGSGQ